MFVTTLKLEERVHLAQPPTTVSQEEGDYGSCIHTVNLVLEHQSRLGGQHNSIHLALSALGLQFFQCGLGFMGSFSASPLLDSRGQVKDQTEQM